jgi:hypothetical protein
MFRPVVIWCLDEASRARVANWYGRVPQECKRFTRCADGWEDVREALREFNTVSYSRSLLELDVGRTGDGTRVIVILVAYGMGQESAYGNWPDVESRLDRLEKEIHHIERQRVLIACQGNHRIGDRTIVCEGIREVPWLVSDRTSRKQILDDQGFEDLLGRLLETLSFASRGISLDAAVPAEAFFLSSPGDDAVRLVGLPEIPLDHLVPKVAEDCAVHLAISSMENVRNEARPGRHILSEVSGKVEAIATNRYTTEDYARELIRQDGLSSRETGELLEHGAGLAADLTKRLEAAVRAYSTRAPAEDPRERSGCVLAVLMPWRTSRRKARSRSRTGPPAMSAEMLAADVAPLQARLSAVCDELRNIKDGFYRRRPSRKPHLPGGMKRTYRQILQNQLSEFMKQWVRGEEDAITGSEVIDRYLAEARAVFDREFVDDLIGGAWVDSHPETKKLALMDRGEFYVFSAAVGSGAEITWGKGIVRPDGPSLDASIFGRVEFYPGTRPEMLLSSRPIAIDKLNW